MGCHVHQPGATQININILGFGGQYKIGFHPSSKDKKKTQT